MTLTLKCNELYSMMLVLTFTVTKATPIDRVALLCYRTCSISSECNSQPWEWTSTHVQPHTQHILAHVYRHRYKDTDTRVHAHAH